MRYINAVCIVLLGCALLSSPAKGWAQGVGKLIAKEPPQEDKVPANLTPEQIDTYLAGLSDEHVRSLLAVDLKEKAAEEGAGDSKENEVAKGTRLVRAFFAAQSELAALYDQLEKVISGAQVSAGPDLWGQLFGGKGLTPFLTTVASLILIILAGFGAERLILRKAEPLRSQLLAEIPRGRWETAGIFLVRLFFCVLGLGIYMLVTFFACFFIHGEEQSAYLVLNTVVLTYHFRLIAMAARLIFSPKSPEFRLVLISDSDARLLYNWIIWITASVIPGAALALTLQRSVASRELSLFVYSTAGPIVSILLAMMILQVRHRVAKAICPLDGPDPIPASLFRQRCADYWHYPALVFVLAVGGYWWVRVLIHGDVTILRLKMSLFLVPFCIGMDQWFKQAIARMGEKRLQSMNIASPEEGANADPGKPAADSSQIRDKALSKGMSIYLPLVHKAFRAALMVFLVFGVLELWGIEFDAGWRFARSILGVGIALLLGVIAWEVAKARIDLKLREEMPFQSDEAQEEGSGGSRSRTLLLLLRKFILIFLFVVVGFSILASLGVNIAPFLAGAGVVGLAIGFGAQALVKDIISGVFFLIDDAFRVGDYVEAGVAKGTVEQISLRSIRLRHPRGQVFVVPFGDLTMVQNFTRDYIIEKLDIRVRFDTNLDMIRKIVKKINKDIRADGELGRHLLSDIKSTGVREMDDSAMIMRVKFKCIPGEQYVLRREVFHRLQSIFKEKGIEFAHRNVTVHLPSQPSQKSGPEAAEGQGVPPEAAGAAAVAIAQAEAEVLARAEARKAK